MGETFRVQPQEVEVAGRVRQRLAGGGQDLRRVELELLQHRAGRQQEDAAVPVIVAARLKALQAAVTQPEAFTRISAVSASSAQSRTSTSYVDIPSTSITVDVRGGSVAIAFGTFPSELTKNTGAAAMIEGSIQLLRDGSPLLELPHKAYVPNGDSCKVCLGMTFVDANPSIGSHTYKLQYKVTNSSVTHAVTVRGIQLQVQVR